MSEPWQEDRYREILRHPGKDGLLTQIWHDAYQEDYPVDADPFGFVTVTDLESIAAELKLGVGALLLDVGCGRGGPGLWVARKTGAVLRGLDILPEAVENATHACDRMGMRGRATFGVGSFASTGLPSRSQRAVMSVDAFWMVLDKRAALEELARIVENGGRLAMTTWAPRVDQLKKMLQSAGFQLLRCEETPRWRERQMAVYRGILRNRGQLEREMGAVAANILLTEAREAPLRLAAAPRRLIVTERQP
jgi:ubiquinone/menaquinone biosynthesis C-methylase UbiE